MKALVDFYKELTKGVKEATEAEKERQRAESSAESVTALRKQVDYLSVIGDERQRIQAIPKRYCRCRFRAIFIITGSN